MVNRTYSCLLQVADEVKTKQLSSWPVVAAVVCTSTSSLQLLAFSQDGRLSSSSSSSSKIDRLECGLLYRVRNTTEFLFYWLLYTALVQNSIAKKCTQVKVW